MRRTLSGRRNLLAARFFAKVSTESHRKTLRRHENIKSVVTRSHCHNKVTFKCKKNILPKIIYNLLVGVIVKKAILMPFLAAFVMASGLTGIASSPVQAQAQAPENKAKTMDIKKKMTEAAKKRNAAMKKRCERYKGAKQKSCLKSLKKRKQFTKKIEKPDA